ncbi:putative glutathione S-transferase [Xylaria digitata]|nr:putative glutathione S-transferase [Xylaria digitata]
MTLIVHHLGLSQSDRVVWLCEELGLDYELKKYTRSPYLAPPEFKSLHPLGSAPVIEDGSVKLAESGACVEYIAQMYGKGRFIIAPGHKDYADYLPNQRCIDFANASFQSALMRDLALKSVGAAGDGTGRTGDISKRFKEKFTLMLTMMNDRLAKVPWLAGEQFTTADIMLVCCLTTMRCFNPYDLGEYENILAYLARVSARDGYRRAMEKGDPELDITQLASAIPPTWQPANLGTSGTG